MNNYRRDDELPIKVLHIGADNIGRGGRSVIVYNLTQHMDSNVIRNDFLCFKKVDKKFENHINDKGGQLQYVLNLPKRSKRFSHEYIRAKSIIKIIKENKYNIVHIHADHAYEAMKSAVLAKNAGCKNIFIHAHATGIPDKSSMGMLLAINVCKRLIPLICNKTFACSKEAAKFMFGKVPENLAIIKNGIELSAYMFNPKLRKKVRTDLRIDDKYIIGCIGRLVEPKNHQFLINVFNEYYKIDRTAILMLVGDGDLKTRIEEMSKELGLRESVMFMGNCNNVEELLQAMDIFVLTSKREGFGIVNIEAQAAGLQCIVSDVIPTMAKVEEEFYFLNIDEPAMTWANCISTAKQKNVKRESSIDLFKEKGYDILDNSLLLQNIYAEILR